MTVEIDQKSTQYKACSEMRLWEAMRHGDWLLRDKGGEPVLGWRGGEEEYKLASRMLEFAFLYFIIHCDYTSVLHDCSSCFLTQTLPSISSAQYKSQPSSHRRHQVFASPTSQNGPLQHTPHISSSTTRQNLQSTSTKYNSPIPTLLHDRLKNPQCPASPPLPHLSPLLLHPTHTHTSPSWGPEPPKQRTDTLHGHAARPRHDPTTTQHPRLILHLDPVGWLRDLPGNIHLFVNVRQDKR